MDCGPCQATEVTFKLLGYAWREIKRCFWLREEMKHTERRLVLLERQVTDVDNKLNDEGIRPSKMVEGWEKEVEKASKDVEKLKGDFERDFKCDKRKSCAGGCRNFWHCEKRGGEQTDLRHGEQRDDGCFGMLPFFWHRYKISCQVYDCKVKVDELEKSYERFRGSYGDRPYPVFPHPGGYTEESFEEEIPKIRDWLMDDKVCIVGLRGMDSRCMASLLKIVHNYNQVRSLFEEKVFFIEVSSSLTCDALAARESISEAMNLRGKVSKDALFTRFSRGKKFPFLLLLNDLQDGFDMNRLEKMVTNIGLPSLTLTKKRCKIVFSSTSENVIAAMNATETSIEVSPSWMASYKAQESSLEVKMVRKEIKKFTDATKIDESSPEYAIVIQISDPAHLLCIACVVQFYYGYGNILLVVLLSWLFVSAWIYLSWWWRTRRREPKTSAVGCFMKLEGRSVSRWISWNRNPAIQAEGDDGTSTGFQTRNQEPGSSSRFERSLVIGEPEPEIVPIDD